MFEQVKNDFTEKMVFNTDILDVSVNQNMIHVLVKDDANWDNLPYVFQFTDNIQIGIAYTTPSRVEAMRKHKEIEVAAIEADPHPTKPVQIKVQEYLSRQ